MTRIAVIVASINRAEEIGQLLAALGRQTLAPARLVLSVEKPADLPAALPLGAIVITGPKGLTQQRNRGLEAALPGADIVVFFDDDFLPAATALRDIATLFAQSPPIVAATGAVLKDGVKAGGVPHAEALAVLAAYEAAPRPAPSIRPTDSVYGCNMAFRAAAIQNIRFDEALPLYAWQEDVDFAGQLLPLGQVVATNAFAGVHRGVAKGRTPGLALGFSQIVNPAYLVRKGTMRRRKAMLLALKNMAANHAKAFTPEPFIDRRGRAAGNWRGLVHLLRGRLDPTAIPRR